MPTSRLGLIGLGLGVGVGGGLLLEKRQRHTTALCNSSSSSSSSSSSVVDSVGNTPLLEIKSLSAATGCRILAKAEYMNPGGSIKDRAALWLIREAERTGQLRKGGTICEGTGGNTGIGLAMLANAMGYRCIFAMGRGIAKEKIEMMRTFGAEVILTPPVPFDSPEHYFHRAAAAAAAGNAREPASHFFTNQFENTASSLAHFESTGPEIWQQAGGRVDGFICSSGTGGTIGGVARYLKQASSGATQVYCIDPPGSGLHGLVTRGRAAAVREGESPSSPPGATPYEGDRVVQYIERSAGDSITEGIGIDRLTANFASALDILDGCLTGSDQEAVEMAFYLLRNEGIFVGPSAALNVVGAVKLARKLPRGSTVTTVLCDGGDRYQSKMYSTSWLEEKGLVPKASGTAVDFIGV